MKLRIEANSLRLRLRQSDVAQFASTGLVEASLDFGERRLTYSLRTSSQAFETFATFAEGRITVSVPHAAAQRWAASNEVAIEGASGPLFILIEKDFQCLHKDAAANADAYPNPAFSGAPSA